MKAIVIGGGIAGLTLARACLDAGIEVEVYEKRDFNSMLSGPGGIFIQKNGMQVYELLWEGRIKERLYQRGGKILTGGFFSKNAVPLYINSPEFVGEEDLGVCITRPDLQDILYHSLPKGTVRNKAAFVGFEETSEGIRAFFEDGGVATGNLLVGADGLYSKVRACLNGMEKQELPIYSGTSCWRGLFEKGNLPLDDRYSWQEFWGRGDRFGCFDVGGGRFGFYGFTNAEVGGNDGSVGGSKQALRSIFSGYSTPVPEIVESLEEEGIYRDDIFDREPLGKQWGGDRVTFIGDAAHPVQPTLGQGGCMGIEDSFELVRQLLIASNLPLQLRQFERSRSDRVEKVFATSRQVGKLAQTDTAIGCFLRDWLYRLTPTWLGNLQFQWLFDYRPEKLLISINN